MRVTEVLGAFMVLLVSISTMAFAQEEQSAEELEEAIIAQSDAVIEEELSGDAGVTPDSAFWRLETAMENFNLALTFGEEAKARKRAQIAKERLLEAKVMAENRNIAGLEKAQAAHKRSLEKLRERIQKVENNDLRKELKTEIELEQTIKSQEEAAAALATRIKVKIKGNLSEEERERLGALIDSLKNESRKAKIEIQGERARAKLKIRAKEAISKEQTDQIDDELEVEVEAESEGNGAETVTFQFIKISENAITHAEKKIAFSGNETRVKSEFHLNNAKAALAKAQAAFEAKDYVEARTIALQARKEALASFSVSSGMEATSEHVFKAKEELKEKRLKTLENAVDNRNELIKKKESRIKEIAEKRNQTLDRKKHLEERKESGKERSIEIKERIVIKSSSSTTD